MSAEEYDKHLDRSLINQKRIILVCGLGPFVGVLAQSVEVYKAGGNISLFSLVYFIASLAGLVYFSHQERVYLPKLAASNESYKRAYRVVDAAEKHQDFDGLIEELGTLSADDKLHPKVRQAVNDLRAKLSKQRWETLNSVGKK